MPSRPRRKPDCISAEPAETALRYISEAAFLRISETTFLPISETALPKCPCPGPSASPKPLFLQLGGRALPLVFASRKPHFLNAHVQVQAQVGNRIIVDLGSRITADL
jgi:hypothetical protein